MSWEGVIRHYRSFLPPVDDRSIVTLLEGNTPLIPAKKGKEYLCQNIELYFKFEGLNPTNSFKDRGMTVAVSIAVQSGAKAVICASTGNTSASAAAYAARASLKAFVIIPQGKIATGKLLQAMASGAKVLQIQGSFDDALKLVRDITDNSLIILVNSLNPNRIEGQKTAAFEICDILGEGPAYHVLPVGNAGNITSYWKGFKEYHKNGKIRRLPKLLGFQAEGAAPLVTGRVVEQPETVASAIRIGNPASWEKAVEARDESGGLIDMVSDRQILEAYRLLASCEGIFCEPASAASLAGVIKLAEKGFFRSTDVVVCTLTGHGLKDPESAAHVSVDPIVLPPEKEKVLEVLEAES